MAPNGQYHALPQIKLDTHSIGGYVGSTDCMDISKNKNFLHSRHLNPVPSAS